MRSIMKSDMKVNREYIEGLLMNEGLLKMSQYFGDEKYADGISADRFLWDGFDRFFLVEEENGMIEIRCSGLIRGEWETAEQFSCDLPEEEIRRYIHRIPDYIPRKEKEIIRQYIGMDETEPEETKETEQKDQETGVYQIHIPEKEEGPPFEGEKQYTSLDDLCEDIAKQIFWFWNHEEYEEALDLAKKMHEFTLQAEGKNGVRTAVALFYEMEAYGRMGDYSSALTVGEEILEMPLMEAAKDTDFYGRALSSLAGNAHLAGDDFSAVEYAGKYIAFCQQQYGPQEEETLQAMMKSIPLYLQVGKLSEAFDLAESSYRISQEIYGPQSDEVLDAVYWIAAVETEMERHEDAVFLNVQRYKVMRKRYGENDPKTLDTVADIFRSLRFAENTEQALPLGRYLMIKAKQIFGEGSEKAVQCEYLYARCHLNAGNDNIAANYFRDCLEKAEKLPGTHTELIRDIREGTASAEEKCGNTEYALEIRRELYQEVQEQYGEYDNRTIEALKRVINMTEYDDPLKARKDLEKLYQLQSAVNGEKSIEALLTQTRIAITFTRVEEYETALEMMKKIHETAAETYGEFHDISVSSGFNLILSYHDAERMEEAMAMAEDKYRKMRKYFGEEAEQTIAVKEALTEMKKENQK